MKRPTISKNRIWSNHEQRVLRVFEHALEKLCVESSLDEHEDSLNRRLLLCVRTANFELNKRDIGVEHPIVYEANNQPVSDDISRASRERKRPDFQWGFLDTKEPDPQRQDKFYVIECKRLGEPKQSNWVFNENYVLNGILRFSTEEHGYGKSVTSGAMIGYIRNMSSQDILDEVNGQIAKVSLHEIKLNKNGWVGKGVSRLEQKLDRPNVPPTPFSLQHLWVDFREG